MEDLLSKYFSGNCNQEEVSKILEWKNQSLENQKEFKIMKAIWESNSGQIKPDTEKALQNILKRLPGQKSPVMKRNISWIKIAAVFILGFGLSIIGYKYLNNRYITYITYSQELNNDSPLYLSDSTTVWLRPGAQISYPEKFKGKFRKIDFNGEGYFKVSPDKRHPFIIVTDNSEIEVLGTEFLVRTSGVDSTTIVIVESGKVQFSSTRNQEIVSQGVILPGEKAFVNPVNRKVYVSINDEGNYQAWKNHELTFRHATLKSVVKDIENCYGVDFDTVSPSVASLTINAVYRGFKFEELIENLQVTLPVRIGEKDGKYSIMPN